MSTESTKVCRFCAEQVKTPAKICPRCRQWLSVFSLRNPTVFIVLLSVAVIMVMAAVTVSVNRSFNRLQNVGTDFTPYRGSISVVESQMNFNNDEKEPRGYVVVIITNKSEIAWKDVELDIRLFDKTGVLIDANTHHDSSIILPHDELSLRIPFEPYKPLTDYAAHKVFIRAARDSRSPF